MFLNSGNGVVFRGALGPWYSEKSKECHLRRDPAKALAEEVLTAYSKDHGGPPAQLFIHSRHRFSDDEWEGFSSAIAPDTTKLVGVRIRPYSGSPAVSARCRRSGSSGHRSYDVKT